MNRQDQVEDKAIDPKLFQELTRKHEDVQRLKSIIYHFRGHPSYLEPFKEDFNTHGLRERLGKSVAAVLEPELQALIAEIAEYIPGYDGEWK